MLRRSFRIGLWLGLLAGIGFALVKRLQGRPEPQPMPQPTPADPEPAPQPIPDPVPLDVRPTPPEPLEPLVPVAEEDTTVPPSGDVLPAAAPAKKAAKRPIKVVRKQAAKAVPAPWVDAKAGSCPSSHPVKAKLGSGIFHLPGMLNYQRTAADRCYVSAEAAEADGLRPAKR